VLFEAPQYTGAGHWYDALLDPDTDPTTIKVEDIDEIFRRSTTKSQGGSFFDRNVSPYDGLPKRLV
jgi:hypothetical protein